MEAEKNLDKEKEKFASEVMPKLKAEAEDWIKRNDLVMKSLCERGFNVR